MKPKSTQREDFFIYRDLQNVALGPRPPADLTLEVSLTVAPGRAVNRRPEDVPALRPHQAVADAADRLDHAGPELLPQRVDVDVDEVRYGVDVVAPDVRQQLLVAPALIPVT